jgi:quercetin dioxygenase-like cupin family protein
MPQTRTAVLAAVLVGAAAVAALAQAPTKKPVSHPASAKHSMVNAADLKWGPAPPGLPPGAQAAVVDGDPTKPGPFVMRAKFPDGYKVPPHSHPIDENLTVLSGSLSLGTGDSVDAGTMTALGPGAFARMPRNVHHYATAKGETIFQLHGMGPFAITYVNPNDDPRKKSTTESR